MNKNLCNAVFTFLKPEDIPDPEFDNAMPEPDQVEEEGDNSPPSYQKSVEGSFDKSYFIAADGKTFRFPDYNKDWKGLVSVKDKTPYNSYYFEDWSAEEKKAYTLDQFEEDFWEPEWEIQNFEDFLKRLPPAVFNKGIDRKETIDLLERFDEYFNERMQTDEFFETFKKHPDTALQLGLVAKAAIETGDLEHLWKGHFSVDELETICKNHGIEPAKTAKTMVKRLLENKVPFPLEGYEPTPLMKDYYLSFVDLYVEEIRKNADHFHPLYFKSLWQDAGWSSENDDVEAKIAAIKNDPYWKDRLIKVEKPPIDWESLLNNK